MAVNITLITSQLKQRKEILIPVKVTTSYPSPNTYNQGQTIFWGEKTITEILKQLLKNDYERLNAIYFIVFSPYPQTFIKLPLAAIGSIHVDLRKSIPHRPYLTV